MKYLSDRQLDHRPLRVLGEVLLDEGLGDGMDLLVDLVVLLRPALRLQSQSGVLRLDVYVYVCVCVCFSFCVCVCFSFCVCIHWRVKGGGRTRFLAPPPDIKKRLFPLFSPV